MGTEPYEVDSDGYPDDVEHLSYFFSDDSSDWLLP